MPFSKHCRTCAARIRRNGSPHAYSLDLNELRPYRDSIAAAIHRHRASKAVQGGLTLASDLLNWQPERDFTTHYQLREQMQRLHAHGVTAEQVLARVCEFFAWLHDHPIKVKRVQDCQLAMSVLKLAPLRGWQRRAHVLQLLAAIITDGGLCRFACGLRMKIEQDRDERAQMLKDLGDYTP